MFGLRADRLFEVSRVKVRKKWIHPVNFLKTPLNFIGKKDRLSVILKCLSKTRSAVCTGSLILKQELALS